MDPDSFKRGNHVWHKPLAGPLQRELVEDNCRSGCLVLLSARRALTHTQSHGMTAVASW